ncbi:MAG TPA: FAD-dependent oxidoreductase [Burkholderiaceae bacterium]|nr:FAD-dependent oxidoreductase [Burkholderiaceae bacterium]
MGQGARVAPALRRRSLLAAALGAPTLVGAGGCSRREPLNFEGGWVGASHARGHRLRAAMPPLPAQLDTERTGVLVVGAGIAGIACARALMRAGVDDLVVLELESAAGGNSRGHRLGGSGCPLGAHYLPLPGPQAHEVSELLFELGLLRSEAGRTVADERHLCHSPQERLFFEGHWHEGLLPPAAPASRTAAQYRAFAQRVAQLQRDLAFALPTQRAPWTAAHAALDAVTFAQWLGREGFDDPLLLWYLDYACRDDYGAGVERVSAWAGLHYFASRHGFQAPGDEADERDPLFTWPEGNAWLVQRMVEPLRDRIRGDHTVLRVDVEREAVQAIAIDEATQQPRRFTARAVVLATPLFVARRLCSAPPAALVAAAERARYAPWLVANLLLESPLLERADGAPLSWDNVLHGSPSLGYVVAQHQSLRADVRATVLTAYWALREDERAALLAEPWRGWAQRVIDDIAIAHPDLPRKVQRVDLMRHGHAMRIPLPGARGDPALAALMQMRGRLQFAHADLAGYSVFEEAYTFGVQAAARVLRELRG